MVKIGKIRKTRLSEQQVNHTPAGAALLGKKNLSEHNLGESSDRSKGGWEDNYRGGMCECVCVGRRLFSGVAAYLGMKPSVHGPSGI